jgi:hypothetical protein
MAHLSWSNLEHATEHKVPVREGFLTPACVAGMRAAWSLCSSPARSPSSPNRAPFDRPFRIYGAAEHARVLDIAQKHCVAETVLISTSTVPNAPEPTS